MTKGQKILQEAKKYNHSTDLLKDIYGIDSKAEYDAVVLAPSWTAKKIYKNTEVKETLLVKHSTFSSYEVEVDGKKLAWIQTGMGASNMVDTALCLAESVMEPSAIYRISLKEVARLKKLCLKIQRLLRKCWRQQI